jgi:hypothetical protein
MSLFACIDPVDVSLPRCFGRWGRSFTLLLNFRTSLSIVLWSLLKSLATFNKFILYPSIVNNNIEILRTICNIYIYIYKTNIGKKIASSFIDVNGSCVFLSYHPFLAHLTQLTLENINYQKCSWCFNYEFDCSFLGLDSSAV